MGSLCHRLDRHRWHSVEFYSGEKYSRTQDWWVRATKYVFCILPVYGLNINGLVAGNLVVGSVSHKKAKTGRGKRNESLSPFTPKASTAGGKVGENNPVVFSLRWGNSMQSNIYPPTHTKPMVAKVCNMHGGVVGVSPFLVMHLWWGKGACQAPYQNEKFRWTHVTAPAGV